MTNFVDNINNILEFVKNKKTIYNITLICNVYIYIKYQIKFSLFI